MALTSESSRFKSEYLIFQYLRENCSTELVDEFCREVKFNKEIDADPQNVGIQEIVKRFYETNIFVRPASNIVLSKRSSRKICKCHMVSKSKCLLQVQHNQAYDFKIRCKDGAKWVVVHCHRNIIVRRSRVFRTMSRNNLKESLQSKYIHIIYICSVSTYF